MSTDLRGEHFHVLAAIGYHIMCHSEPAKNLAFGIVRSFVEAE